MGQIETVIGEPWDPQDASPIDPQGPAEEQIYRLAILGAGAEWQDHPCCGGEGTHSCRLQQGWRQDWPEGWDRYIQGLITFQLPGQEFSPCDFLAEPTRTIRYRLVQRGDRLEVDWEVDGVDPGEADQYGTLPDRPLLSIPQASAA
ncbi:MAG: hypothetical protein Q7T33_01235 [Dehalococcoidia bacterium]|nr:hypothetical protein [Dehalococcoidia bacterium]